MANETDQALEGVNTPGVVVEVDRRMAEDLGAFESNHIERLNCTLRQRVSRLVRATLSFSKKLDNHVGAIKYFLSHYNLELARA